MRGTPLAHTRTACPRLHAARCAQIVVRGIPWSYTWAELKDMFAEIGGVERADVMVGDDGRSRGYGTVRFTSAEAAQAAIAAFNTRDCDGRSLSVFMDKFA